jgi:DNA-binding transcriptional ArsR family regulator
VSDDQEHEDLIKALNHPLRRGILRRVARTGEAISPREIAAGLHQPLSNVSYHVRVLAECKAVALVRTKPVRGSMQHFYALDLDAPWALEALGIAPG